MRARLRHILRVYRRGIIFCAGIFFGAVFVISYWGLYPIAVVNGDWVSARRFNLHMNAAEQYEAQEAATSTNPSVLRSKDLTVSIVSGLIEEQLIRQGAEKEFGAELKNLERQRTNAFLERASSIEAESKKYGLNKEKFEKEILRPQVVRDLLAGRLFLESLRLEDWLLAEKRKASVSIFSEIFLWNGEEVVAR